MVNTTSCNGGHRGENSKAWLQRDRRRADKSVKNGLQLEKDVLVESDFPSGGRRDVKRKKGQEEVMAWRQTKCDSVCVCVRETEMLSIY